MKKFKFGLDTVLSYKQQVLDALQGEHAAILARVHRQETLVEECWQRYRAYNEDYRDRAREGLAITEAMICEAGLRAMEREIQQETAKLQALREAAEKKREEVVEARKETSSIEKLREKKRADYNKALAKSEEQAIEEFVSMTRVIQAAGA
ncbi:MAG: flagellar export protein FliJ [Oscillibacter sp.]|nr:flagellar export protein FliJ [Oscillibacter sp.]